MPIPWTKFSKIFQNVIYAHRNICPSDTVTVLPFKGLPPGCDSSEIFSFCSIDMSFHSILKNLLCSIYLLCSLDFWAQNELLVTTTPSNRRWLTGALGFGVNLVKMTTNHMIIYWNNLRAGIAVSNSIFTTIH